MKNETLARYGLLLGLVWMLMSYQQATAQSNQQLSEAERAEFKELCERKVRDFEDYIEKIGIKTTEESLKSVYIRQCLRLFIDKGVGRTIEIYSPRRNSSRERQVSSYLHALAKLPYAQINITHSEVRKISNLQAKGLDSDGFVIYAGVASICMRFEAKDGEGNVLVPSHVTCKDIEIELSMRDDPEYGAPRWTILLGDIVVSRTEI